METGRDRDEALSGLKAQSVLSRARVQVSVEKRETQLGRSETELGYYLRDTELRA